jgi:hypothetical protein
MKRRFVSLTRTVHDNYCTLDAICDEGRAWWLVAGIDGAPDDWTEMQPLPEAPRALEATKTTKAPEATDKELCAIWDIPGHSFSETLRAIYNLGRRHGSAAALAPEPTCEPTPDSPPADCAQRLIRERRMVRPLRGKPYAGCPACGDDSPRWESCRRALAQELPPATGSLLDQVAAAIARAHGDRFPWEEYRSDAQWAVRAVERWLSDERWPSVAAVLRSGVERG